MTGRGRTAEEMQAARRELAARLRDATIRAITSAIAHDINQPLAAIVTDANAGLRWLDRAEPDIEEARAVLGRIVEEGHRAGKMIADIRAKFTGAGEEPRAVKISAAVSDVLGLLADELNAHRIAVQSDLPASLPPALVDPAALQLLFFNLVVNAIEAMADVADRERVLTIAAQPADGDDLLIAFEDNGAGIAAADMDRLFATFFTTKAGHAGMGLPISRKIVEAHGGRLWAKARQPHGAAVFAQLPSAAPSASASDI